MDKYEYKVRTEEIKELISHREYVQAAEIADTIDWRRVKSVMMLCTISDLYKINRRYEDSYDLLLLAYDRHPGGRTIVYALCELAIKMGNVTQAWEYYKEYMQIAPKDAGRYILQYKIYEAEEVNLEERIAVLEELKKRDYRERWAYELAYLYHRIGLASKCVDECDEMIVWFGEGKYVIKAMELKMLHQPLSPQQQAMYDRRFAPVVEEPVAEEVTQEPIVEEVQPEQAPATTTMWSKAQVAAAEGLSEVEFAQTKRIPYEEIDIKVKTIDPSKPGDTINLSEHIRAGLQELLEDDSTDAAITRAIIAPMLETDRLDNEAVNEELEVQATQDNEEFSTTQQEFDGTCVKDEAPAEAAVYETEAEQAVRETEVFHGEMSSAQAEQVINTEVIGDAEEEQGNNKVADTTAATIMEQLRQERTEEQPKQMEQKLSMEADGQISFVIPEKESIEKQITGQISIADIMAEWERKKKEIEEKSKEKIIRSVKRDTDRMFTEFEAAKRDGLLEQLERGRGLEQVIAEAEGKYVDEDGVAIPPSLVEDTEDESGEEGFIEEYEAISFEEAARAVEPAKGKMVRTVSVEEQEMEPEEVLSAEDVVEELTEIEDLTEEEESAEAKEVSETTKYEQESVPETEEAVEEFADTAEYEQESVPETEEVAEEVTDTAEYEQEVVPETEEAAEEVADTAEYEQKSVPETEEAAEEVTDTVEYMQETEEYFEGPVKQMEEAILATEYEAEEPAMVETLTEESDVEEDIWENEEACKEETSQAEFMEEESRFSEMDAAYEAALTGATEEVDDGRGIDYDTISMPASEVDSAIKQEKLRNLTREEKELFSPYIQGRSSKIQLVKTIDNISMAAYTGNVVITGAEGLDTLGLARDLIRNVQLTDSNFSGKIAKISGDSLNKRDVATVLEGLDNGALIVQKAPAMNAKTVEALHKALQQEHMGIVVILEGTKKAMNAFLVRNAKLHACFTGRIDMEALSDAALVSFGKKYAREKEYAIDEFGGLALSKRIAERQTCDHAVTILEVKEIVDAAIESANRKTLGHFLDVLMAKRYDEEDMIIIKEKDFR